MNRSVLILFSFMVFIQLQGRAQITQPPVQPVNQPPNATAQIDSMRKLDEEGKDTVVFTSKYIRYTTRAFLNDSTYTMPLDTSLKNFQVYNPLYLPERPTVNLGNLGLAYREMLYNPRKTLGFDAGFHSLDFYLQTQDSVKYYRARTPFTELFYINGGSAEQLFTLTHTQNIRPNLNFGAVYKRIGADGFYQAQRGDHTNVILFSWFQSNNKRYNLLLNGLFNTLKAGENGGAVNDTLYSPNYQSLGPRTGEAVFLKSTGKNRPAQSWKGREFSFKQYYYIGRVDSIIGDSSSAVLPTQRLTHTFTYSTNQYKFFRNEEDTNNALPAVPSAILTNDSTNVSNLRNEFSYSFYLRGRSVKLIKNEMKLDVGLRHDLYKYRQMGYQADFQSTMLKANAGYRFSDRVSLIADLHQVIYGRNFLDFLYEASTSVLLSKSAGRIVIGAYQLNRSPDEIYDRVNYQFQQWNQKFGKTKVSDLSFGYENAPLKLKAKAEYMLLSSYLYFDETATAKVVAPKQASDPISLLKVSLNKNFVFGAFRLDNFMVYQATDSRDILRVPGLYLYNSLYYSKRIIKSIESEIGIDSRYNTRYQAPSYSINISQFYNGGSTEFTAYPVVDVWLKASLKRANVFLKYNYINQGVFSRGYYTVNKYPMPDKLFDFGVKWAFYN